MLLNKQIYRMAAGGDYYISVLFAEYSFIFILDNSCTYCCFLNIVKAHFLKCFSHCVYACAVIVGNKGRCKRNYNRVTALDKHLYLFGFINYLLCILRTDNEALSAKNTLIVYNMCLIARKANGFNRAMTNAFIAVFTV